MVQKDLGFVLKRYNFRETSLIASIYTEKFGKIRGILKGFYTNKREFSSPIDIFSLNEFVFYPKKSEIWLIAHADIISDYDFLRSDLAKAKVAGRIFNFIERTIEIWDSNPYIFNLIKNCLDLLGKDITVGATRRVAPTLTLCIFLIKFLTLSGFKPELNHCISCQALLKQENAFSVARGGFVCPQCRNKLSDIRVLSQQASRCINYIQNSDFDLINRLQIPAKCQEEVSAVLRSFTAYHFEADYLS
ncbi:MAG: DNA repair protein RecO [Candidatus Omnitrophica bacterium]|nr:DNA repair protein RecO [Candidatus Omnitrophota bacterium]MBU2044744.1 DNA repair protein RecO [Candidatus Omnitrophota bacterium]MBU2250882.1 DNA repair protein RecO [Candidatus Omnitrophota bacterium]MBU2473887.1 DNA repair protein RecO [Candidatus Omnitrophota bacterium]